MSAKGNDNGNTLAFQFEDIPQRWDYLVHIAHQTDVLSELKIKGQEGWELVQAMPVAVPVNGPGGTLNGHGGSGLLLPQGQQQQVAIGLQMILKRPAAMIGHGDRRVKTSAN